jgi:flagellar motor switch protein FliN/FliY
MRQSWKNRFEKKGLSERTKKLAEFLEVPIHLEVGRAEMNVEDWAKVKPGDFIILDRCYLDPDEEKGRIILTVNDIPVFRGKLKEVNVKILEYPLYHEVQTTMTSKNFDEEEGEENELEDEEEFEEEEFEEEEPEEEEEEPEEEEEGFEEEEEEFEGYEEEGEEKAAAPFGAVAAPPKAIPPVAPTKEAPPPPITPEQIPINLIVEVGRLQMTVKKLLELEPGNLLELGIHPEEGVDLVANGKRVGKGELIRLGESLGVRVLEVGT